MDLAARIGEMIRGVVEGEGCELVHVEFQPGGAGSILRIYIDKPDGINLTDCQKVSRNVGVLLDVEDWIPHKYTLEVTSPGIERPLFRQSDYVRYVGEEIRITTFDKIDGRKKFKGQLLSFDGDILKIECEKEVFKVPFDSVKKGNLVYHF